MSNGRISFDVNGEKHSLYFGMVATEIIAVKSALMVENNSQNSVKSFAYIVYGGLCNSADLKDEKHPSFEDAYLLAESITDNNLQTEIVNCFTESKATKELMDKLGVSGDKKKEAESVKS